MTVGIASSREPAQCSPDGQALTNGDEVVYRLCVDRDCLAVRPGWSHAHFVEVKRVQQ